MKIFRVLGERAFNFVDVVLVSTLYHLFVYNWKLGIVALVVGVFLSHLCGYRPDRRVRQRGGRRKTDVLNHDFTQATTQSSRMDIRK